MTYKLVGGLFFAVGVFGLFTIFDNWQPIFGLSFGSDLFAYAGVAAIAAGSILWSLESRGIQSRR